MKLFCIIIRSLLLLGCAAASSPPHRKAEIAIGEPLSSCGQIEGAFSAVGADTTTGANVFYYEIATPRRPNVAERLVLNFDSNASGLTVRQFDRQGREVVGSWTIKGKCIRGSWVGEFNDRISADGGSVLLVAQIQITADQSGLSVRYSKREETRKAVHQHDRSGRFPRL